jgi:hypothetical protein
MRNSTPRTSTSEFLLAVNPPTRQRKPAKLSAAPIDPATLPEIYAMTVTGDCMEPAIRHGSRARFSTTETYKAGDIVCLWFTPSGAEKMGVPRALKRLRLALAPWVKGFPYKENPASEVAAVAVFESDNPRRTYSLRCSEIAAIHKFIGCE